MKNFVIVLLVASMAFGGGFLVAEMSFEKAVVIAVDKVKLEAKANLDHRMSIHKEQVLKLRADFDEKNSDMKHDFEEAKKSYEKAIMQKKKAVKSIKKLVKKHLPKKVK